MRHIQLAEAVEVEHGDRERMAVSPRPIDLGD
jgi:hypothetical protein